MESYNDLCAKLDVWTKSPESRDTLGHEIFCGYDSLPISIFRGALLSNAASADLQLRLGQVLNLIETCFDAGLFREQACGIIHSCIAADSSLDPVERSEAFVKAAKRFDSAMPGLPSVCPEGQVDIPDEWQREQIEGLATANPVLLGAGVATIELIQRLTNPDIAPNKARTATTPVLFRLGDSTDAEGFVGLLQVELVTDGVVGITPDLSILGANVIHSAGRDNADSLHESVSQIWKMAELVGCRARWSIRPFESVENKTQKPLDLLYLEGRSMEAALLVALWAANGGIPSDDYQSDTAFEMEPKIAVTAVVTDNKRTEPGSFEIDAVYGVDSKLRAAEKQQLQTVVLADRRANDADDSIDAYRNETNAAFSNYQAIESRNNKIQMQSAAAGNSEQLYSLTVLRKSTAREVFDSLLVTNRHLADWQKAGRYNWLSRWAPRTADSRGARAPDDDAWGPDDDNGESSAVAATETQPTDGE